MASEHLEQIEGFSEVASLETIDLVGPVRGQIAERSELVADRCARMERFVRAVSRHRADVPSVAVDAAGLAAIGFATVDDDMVRRHLVGEPLTEADLVALDAVPASTRRLLERSAADPAIVDIVMAALPLDPYQSDRAPLDLAAGLVRLAGCVDLLERRGLDPQAIAAELRRSPALDRELVGDVMASVYLPGRALLASLPDLDSVDIDG